MDCQSIEESEVLDELFRDSASEDNIFNDDIDDDPDFTVDALFDNLG